MPDGYCDEYEDEFSEEYSDSACGYPVGLSVWAVGLEPDRPEGSKGPLKGVTQRPPSITVGRKREPGSRGPLPVEHPFLNIARSRLRPHKRKKIPVPMSWDRLKGFREILWFLILAGYSPTFMREFFCLELPNLFPKLSKEGVTSSVRKTQKLAKDGQVHLDRELADTLAEYNAGPWAHNAPDWLRLQYGVPLAETETKGKRSRKEAARKLPDALVESGDKSAEDLQKEGLFLDAWLKYIAGSPGTPSLIPEELALGVAKGVFAVLASRASSGICGNKATDEVPVVSPSVSPVAISVGSALSATPGGAGSESAVGEVESLKLARLLEEVTLAEAATGQPLNLTPSEMMDAFKLGLGVVLKRRLTSVSAKPVAKLGASEPAAIIEPTVHGASDVTSGIGEEPVDSGRLLPTVTATSGEVAPPVARVNELGARGEGKDVASGDLSSDSSVEEVNPAVSSPKAPEAVIPESVDPPKKEKRVFAPRKPKASDPVPESEWLRDHALGIAVGVRGGDGVDPLNIGKVPRVWVVDEARFLKADVEPSAFYKTLGSAAPYLVGHIQDEKYGDWVLTGDNGISLYERFGGNTPKEKIDLISEPPPTRFPQLDAAPKNKAEMYHLTLDQAKDCFDEWDERWVSETPEIICPLGYKERMLMVGPHSMLLDLVDRGMGPAYWRVHESFMIHWIMGLAVRHSFGFPMVWSHQGGKRYLPLARIPTVESVLSFESVAYARFCPWRSTAPILIESLAPRRESENLPGHVWVNGMGYLSDEAYAKAKEYLRINNHPDLNGSEDKTTAILKNWCMDIERRVSHRSWMVPEVVSDMECCFIDSWIPDLHVHVQGDNGQWSPASPLFCNSGSPAARYGMREYEWMTQSTMNEWTNGHKSPWEKIHGFPQVSDALSRIYFEVHLPSLYAVTAYLQFLEDRRPLTNGKSMRGMLFPERMLLSREQVRFPPKLEDRPFRDNFKRASRG